MKTFWLVIIALSSLPNLAHANVVHVAGAKTRSETVEKQTTDESVKKVRDLIGKLSGPLQSRSEAEVSLKAMESQKDLVMKELSFARKNPPDLESYMRIERLMHHYEPYVPARTVFEGFARALKSSPKLKETTKAFDTFLARFSAAQRKELKTLQDGLIESYKRLTMLEDPVAQAKAEKENLALFPRAQDWLRRHLKGIPGFTFLDETKGDDGIYFRIRIDGAEIALLLMRNGELVAKAPPIRLDLSGELPRYGTLPGGASIFHSRPLVVTVPDTHLYYSGESYVIGLGSTQLTIFGFQDQARHVGRILSHAIPQVSPDAFEQELDGDQPPSLGIVSAAEVP